MPLYWIDVEDASGAKLGDGPILSATDWTFARGMNRVGSFSFSMPRDDPRAALIQPKRRVACWTYAGGTLQQRGAGIVNDVRTTVTNENRAMLTASGDSRMGELLDRVIRVETFTEQVWVHPARVWFGDGVNSAASAIDLAVGDTTTWQTYTASSLTPIIIRLPVKFDGIRFTLHDAQTSGGDGTIAYQTRDGTGDGQWTAFTPDTNTTLTTAGPADVWFGQSGEITWNIDDLSGWELRDADEIPGVAEVTYAIRIIPAVGGWSTFSIADIAVRVTEPTNDVLGKIMAYAPTGWTLDAANGYTTLQAKPLSDTELVTNGGFETYTGTPDDGTSDAWTGWSTANVSDGAGNSVLADTSTKHSGAAAVLLTHGTGTRSLITQNVPVEPSTEYTVSYWTRAGAASGQAFLSLYALTSASIVDRFFMADSLVTGTTWTEVTAIVTTPVDCTEMQLYFYAPSTDSASAYIDDVSVRAGGGQAISLDSQGETVLENLVRIHETTGENFTESPSAGQVLWLGNDVRDSGMRAVANVDPIAVEGHDDICLIVSLSEVATGTDLYSRIYPYGGGRNPAPTLLNTTREAPHGYVLNKGENYIERTQSVSAYGRIEVALDFSDITNISGDTNGDIHGSNMVFDRGLLWLQQHSATNLALDGGDMPRVYDIELAKCNRELLPGYTLRVQYDRYVAGTRTMHLDADLWILGATTRVTAEGVETVAVQCATVAAAPTNDYTYLVDLTRQAKAMRRHQ